MNMDMLTAMLGGLLGVLTALFAPPIVTGVLFIVLVFVALVPALKAIQFIALVAVASMGVVFLIKVVLYSQITPAVIWPTLRALGII